LVFLSYFIVENAVICGLTNDEVKGVW